MIKTVGAFITEFFDANPLSQLGIVVSHDAQAFRISPLSSNPRNHLEQLASLGEPSGDVSIQNALQLCVAQVKKRFCFAAPHSFQLTVVVASSRASSCNERNSIRVELADIVRSR